MFQHPLHSVKNLMYKDGRNVSRTRYKLQLKPGPAIKSLVLLTENCHAWGTVLTYFYTDVCGMTYTKPRNLQYFSVFTF